MITLFNVLTINLESVSAYKHATERIFSSNIVVDFFGKVDVLV